MPQNVQKAFSQIPDGLHSIRTIGRTNIVLFFIYQTYLFDTFYTMDLEREVG